MVKFRRQLDGDEVGSDVEAVKRALAQSGFLSGLKLLMEKPLKERQMMRPSTVQGIKAFNKTIGLPHGVYTAETHAHLAPLFDSRSNFLYKKFEPVNPKLQSFNRLINVMVKMTEQTPGYVYGGGHGEPLGEISYRQGLDCSSSVSKALHDGGFFPEKYAWVSGQFEKYGVPGVGSYFTVYYNGEHVWIRLYKSRWWRFDTSPHGDGGRGPRLRMLPRSTRRFAARHWSGF